MPDVMGYWGGLGLGPGESDTRMPKPATMTWSCSAGSGTRVGVVCIVSHEGPEYRGVSVRACICSMAGKCEGEEAGGGRAIMCCLHLPPRNAHAVQSGTTHLPPPCRVHRLLERASVVHPDIVQGMLLCRLRMPSDCGTWLWPGDEMGWWRYWRMHLLLRATFLVHPGVIHRCPPP